ncbi:MAG: hypothetical protein JNL11_07960 [Bdellovibrionaceae bacterium]|nr:hypothetical protein [Pseudobdellovibrionaceae bacterium]
MLKLVSIIVLVVNLDGFAQKVEYRNSAEMTIKRSQMFQDLMGAIDSRKAALQDHVREVNKQIDIEQKQKNPKMTSSCEKPDSKAAQKVTLYDEREEAEKQLAELKTRAYAARVVLSNATTHFIKSGTTPTDFGTKDLKQKALQASVDFPEKPSTFTRESFCDEVIKKYQIPEGMGLKLNPASTPFIKIKDIK